MTRPNRKVGTLGEKLRDAGFKGATTSTEDLAVVHLRRNKWKPGAALRGFYEEVTEQSRHLVLIVGRNALQAYCLTFLNVVADANKPKVVVVKSPVTERRTRPDPLPGGGISNFDPSPKATERRRNEVCEKLMVTYIVDGRSIGSLRYRELVPLATKYRQLARVLEAIHAHVIPSDMDACVRDIISEATLKKLIDTTD